MKEHQPLTLSGVDEKPPKRSPNTYGVLGLFVYSMLTEAGAAIGCKVADFY